MTCREAIEFLAGYLDGELSPEVRAEFDHHLTLCPSCVAYLATYQATIRLEKAALASTDVVPTPPLPEELVQAILALQKRP